MDIDRRKWRAATQIPVFLIFSILFLLSKAPPSVCSTLYFTNYSNIDKLENEVITSVIKAGSLLEALDCNSCDDRIYWINGREIKRSFPNSSSSIESVLSYGITRPVGVAVDWRGNNVYFTDQILDEAGSVEVVTCDGKHRRVLLREGLVDDFEYQHAGPIAVDALHGYIFFADIYCCIWRSNMDGTNYTKIIPTVPTDVSQIMDLAIDYNNSVLYWVDNEQIHFSNYDGSNLGVVSSVVLNSSVPVGVSIDDGVLYWTQRKSGSKEGAIFSYDLEGQLKVANVINSNDAFDPHDISAFVSKDVTSSVSSGCSNQTGGCNHFCFTLPDPDNPQSISSSFTCACRTGFSFKTDDSKICLEAPLNFLLVGEGPYIYLVSFDIPKEDIPLPIPITTNGTVDYITYDRSHHLVYWTQRDPPAIWQSMLDGEDHKALITESISLPQGIVVSDEGTNLYWADSALDKIEVVSLYEDAFHRRTLIDTGLDHPIGLAINESIGFIYWTDTGLTPLVERAAKNGSFREAFYTSNYLPGPITVNVETGDLYWSDSHPDKLGIYTSGSDGQNGQKLAIDLTGQNVVGLAVSREMLYWTDRINGRLWRRSLTGGLPASPDLIAEYLGSVRDVTAADLDAPPIETGCSHDNGGCEHICVASPGGGGHSCLCQDHHIPDETDNTRCKEERPATLIISTNVSVLIIPESLNLDASSTLPISARSLDVDYAGQVLYWIGLKDGIIYRSNITSSSPNASDYVTTPIATCCYGYIADLAVDWWGRNLYWTDNETGTIWVSKLSGESRQVLKDALDSPTYLVIDPYKSELYYVAGDNKVMSVSMNGVGSENLLWDPAPNPLPILDLTIDVNEHVLYWTHNLSLYRYNLTSQKLLLVFSSTKHPPSKLSYYNEDVYVLQYSNRICKVHKNGHKCVGFVFLVTLFFPDRPDDIPITGMAFNHYSVQPDVHWCTKTNGECEGSPEPLCLVTEHYDRQCQCAPTEFLRVTYDNDRQVCRYTCTVSDNFLLLSNSSKVFYLPLLDPEFVNQEQGAADSSCVDTPPPPRELPLGGMGKIQAISFDPLSERIFWIDGTSDTINSNTLDGTERRTVARYDSLNASSMAYDWRSGTVFWTENVGTQIDAVTHDGRGSGTVFEYPYSPANVWEPIKIAVDSKESILYWSKSSDFSVNTISLYSTSSYNSIKMSLNSTKKVQIGAMTIEPQNNILFWYNKRTRAIEGVDIAQNKLTTVYDRVTDDDQVTAMTASTLGDHVFLLWYNQSDWTVRYYNMTAQVSGVYRQLEEHKVIVSMTVHDKSILNYIGEYPCLADNISCSHFCSPPRTFSTSLNHHDCACPLHRQLMSDSNQCSELMCGAQEFACSDHSNCYHNSSKCDGIKNCQDASDEANCICPRLGQMECIPGDKSVPCVEFGSLCQNDHCDRSRCNCSRDEFQCSMYGRVECLPSSFKCDGEEDCPSGDDEKGCKATVVTTTSTSLVSMSSPSVTDTPTPSSIGSAIVSVISVLGVAALLVAIGICGITAHCIVSRRHKEIHHMQQELTSLKTTSTSPQPSQNKSLYTSDLSINTMVTGSTNVDKTSQEARFINLKRLSTLSTDPSNPPNSPITHRSVAFTIGGAETCTMYSEVDPPIPPAPNPSLNYDAISNEGLTSVSQRRYPAVLPSNGVSRNHESPPPPYFSAQMGEGSYVYGDEDSMDAYKEYLPPINRSMLYHQVNGVQPHLDNNSETTFSMTTYNEITQDQSYSCNEYLPTEEPPMREAGQGEGDEGEHREGHVIHPYDCPPPPSPVTEYSVHGE